MNASDTPGQRPSPRRFSAQRWLGVLVTLAAALAVLSPTLFGWRDSFPLSTFPMFASSRARSTLESLRGVKGDGSRVGIPPELLGTSEVMQARTLVGAAVQGGKATARRFCRTIAERVARDPRYEDVQKLELSRDVYDVVRYFTEGPTPLQASVVATCGVPRADSNGQTAPEVSAP